MTVVKAILLALAAAGSGVQTSALAAPVGDALQRPALQVRQPERSVLLAAAQAGQRIVAVGERGMVALSEDQGQTWRQVPCPVSVTLTMVRFADAQHGVAVGHGGTVLTTADGGASWQLRLDGVQLAAIAQRVAQGEQAQADAQRLKDDGPDKPFLDVLMWDAQRILAVGAYGLAFHTVDGGKTWQPWMDRLPNPRAMHWYVARRAGDTVWLAGEQGVLARSGDGGNSFQAVESPYRGSWFTGELQADGAVLLAGLRGNVWRSADGGRNWAQLPLPVPASVAASAGAAQGSFFLAGQAGVVLHGKGGTVKPLNTTPLPPLAGVLPLNDGRVLTVGLGGVVTLPAPAAKEGGRP